MLIAPLCEAILKADKKPTVPDVSILVQIYYKKTGNEAGGSLHVVLDDHNLEDDFVRDAIEWAREQGDADGKALGEVLLRMSKTQRGVLARRKRG